MKATPNTHRLPLEEGAVQQTSRLTLEDGAVVRFVLRKADQPSVARLVFIHGNPGTLEDWTALVHFLPPNLELLLVDLPGFGDSTRGSDLSTGGVSLRRLAGAVIQVLDHLKWKEPVFFVGHSHGGGVAQVLAASHAERAKGLVLLATLGAITHASYRLLGLWGMQMVIRGLTALFRSRGASRLKLWLVRALSRDIFFPEPVTPRRTASELDKLQRRPEVLRSMWEVAQGAPCLELKHLAPAISVPCLVVHGEEDRVVPVRAAKEIFDAVSPRGGDKSWLLLPDAGHLLIEYQARSCAEAILTFVHDHVASAASETRRRAPRLD